MHNYFPGSNVLDKHIMVQELIMVTCLQNSDGDFKQFVTLLWSKPLLYTFLQVNEHGTNGIQ